MPSDPPPSPPPWPRRYNEPSAPSDRYIERRNSQQDACIDDLARRFDDLNRAIYCERLEARTGVPPSDEDIARYDESVRRAKDAQKQPHSMAHHGPRIDQSDRGPLSHRYDHHSTTKPLPNRHLPDFGPINYDLPGDSLVSTRNAPESRPYRGHGYQRSGSGSPSTENPQLTPPSVTEDMDDLPEDDPMSRFHMPRPPRAVDYERASAFQHDQGPSRSRSERLPEGWSWHPGYTQISSSIPPEKMFMAGPHWCYTSPGGRTKVVKPATPADEAGPTRRRHHRPAQREERRSGLSNDSRSSSPPVPRRPEPGWSWRPGYRMIDSRFPLEERAVLALPHWIFRSPGGRVKKRCRMKH